MLSFTLVMLAALPEAGSTWKWSFDDTRVVKLESGPKGLSLHALPHLEKTELELSIEELGEEAPKRFTMKVLRGPRKLAGRTWKVTSNYGEAGLSEVAGKKKALDENDDPAVEERVLQRLVGTLFSPDPIVVASAGEDRCGEATRAKVATAAAKLVGRLTLAHSEEAKIIGASATCVGSAGKYALTFTISSMFEDQVVEFPWQGTAESPAGAWRSTLQLSSVATNEIQTGKKAIRMKTTSGLKSALTKKK